MILKRLLILAMALLALSGCAGQSMPPHSPLEKAEVTAMPVETASAAAITTQAITPTRLRRVATEEGREAIVKTIPAGGIDELDIYAGLCTLALEPSTTDDFQVVFSYPELAGPNYEAHFQLNVSGERTNALSISTDYENQRWDTAFDPIDGFDGTRYRQTALLTIRVPQRQYEKISLRLVTGGSTLQISGVDTAALHIQISTGDMEIDVDRAYRQLSVDHKVGNVTLRTPSLGEQLHVSGKIGVFTLSLPTEPADLSLEIQYDETAAQGGDEGVYILPVTWEPTLDGHTVRYERGAGTKRVVVKNEKYGVFAAQIDGIAAGEPASAL